MGKNRQVWGWISYDFANTIYSMNVVSLYFSLWITVDNGREDIWVSLANSLSMLMVALSLPGLGVISDRYRRRMPFLLGLTLSCVLFTSLISVVGWTVPSSGWRVGLALSFFVLANYSYQGGLVFYNALLPQVSPPRLMGRVSGYGTAMGYLGAIVGLALVMPFSRGRLFGWAIPLIAGGGRVATFLPTGIFFLLFSLPTFLLVREDGEGRVLPQISRREVWGKVWEGVSNTKRYPGVLRFLIAKYLYEDAIATVIIFMGVYGNRVMGFSDALLVPFLMVSTSTAIIGSLGFGYLTDRIGPQRTLLLVLAGWIGCLGSLALLSAPFLFWIIGSLIGAFLGGTWASSRPLLVSLVPQEMLGEFFGLYSLSGKLAAIAGPLIWGGIVLFFRPWGIIRYKLAVVALVLMVGAGFVVLLRVPAGPPSQDTPQRGRAPTKPQNPNETNG